MSSVYFSPVQNSIAMKARQNSFTANPVEHQKKSTVAGKIAGGLAGYTLLAPAANKAVATKILPRISSIFKPLAESLKALPTYIVNPRKIPMDKVMNAGEQMMKLSPKAKIIGGIILAASTLATVLLGAKVGSYIQSKFQKN